MPSFFDQSNFINVIYALDIEIEKYFGGAIFDDDLSRIIYASNNYCFRKRCATNDINVTNLNLPFMNFKLTNISLNTDRKWFNHIANVEGIFSETIGKKIKIVPILAEYESNIFTERMDDILNAFGLFLRDNSNETVLNLNVTIDDQDFSFNAVLSYNFTFDEYNENDWLEQNKIHSLAINFNFNCYLAFVNESGYGISDTVILNYLTYKYGDDFDTDDPYKTLTEQFTASDDPIIGTI